MYIGIQSIHPNQAFCSPILIVGCEERKKHAIQIPKLTGKFYEIVITHFNKVCNFKVFKQNDSYFQNKLNKNHSEF